MSDSARVLVFAGDGGAGTTTFARRTADEMRDLGLSVEEVDASGEVLGELSADLVSDLQRTIGLLWREAGADPMLVEEWSGLAGLRLVEAWQAIASARRTADVVVVDAGSLARLRDLAATPGTLLRLIDAAMTPRSAMWRSSSGDADLFESLSTARLAARDWCAVLQGPRTSARLLARPDGATIPRVLRTRDQVTIMGMLVDGIIVGQVPAKKDRRRRPERQRALAARNEYRERAPGMPVWHSTSRITMAPRGARAVDVLIDPRLSTPRASTFVVEENGDGFTLLVPLRDVAGEVRVGVQGASLVLALDGVNAWHELPSVLARCDAVRVQYVDHGYVVRWEPVRDLWSASLVDGHAAGGDLDAGGNA